MILVQMAAAVPWLTALDPRAVKKVLRLPVTWIVALAAALVAGGILGMFINFVQEPSQLHGWGQGYGAVLQLQLVFDFFALLFPLLLFVWPQGGAIALAAFREGIRQPLFWFILGLAVLIMVVSPFFPYFTFGEDAKMVRELGYDLVMLAAVLFAVVDASIRISEEIEGRTAITVMSKPVSRRQFLVGKFAGILLAALLMSAMLGFVFNGAMWFKLWFDREPMNDPVWLEAAHRAWNGPLTEAGANFLIGAVIWFDTILISVPGFMFGFCQVMVLLAIAVALATRFPMVINLVTCLFIFFAGHLTHVLVAVSQGKFALVNFMARFFDIILPGLVYFDYGPIVVRDIPLEAGKFAFYLGSVTLYAVVYSIIALLLGLILFEDRDLA
jgi:hypothetical protein